MRSKPDRTIPAASTPSATSTAATTPCIPSSARSPISAGWSMPAARTTWRSRSTSRCNARPTIPGSSSIRNGSAAAGRLDQATRRTRRRNTRTSSTRISTAPTRIALWEALRDVILFWVEQGVRIFRVDNPHTKPFPFWEWLIHEVQAEHPDVMFLAEAFTRPKIMKALAKLGFTQSYTYFTWRTEKTEIQDYLRELTGYPEREYFRPNFFVTTPDITAGAIAERRAVAVQVARRARRHARRQLRHLQRLRTDRARADPRPRGIHQFGKIRDSRRATGTSPAISRTTCAGSTPSGARMPRCCRPRTCASCRWTMPA